jgi:flagellar export protein FliJ
VSAQPRLGVVARVRGVRERDSRIGLVEALEEERTAEARVLALQEQLTAMSSFEAGRLAEFAARQRAVTALGEALTAARSRLDSARVVALAAREQWRTDRSRLAAVETLIEHREAEQRQEQRRREDRRLDAVAEDLWRRRNAGGTAGAVTP